VLGERAAATAERAARKRKEVYGMTKKSFYELKSCLALANE
jgi:hypothetical protein